MKMLLKFLSWLGSFFKKKPKPLIVEDAGLPEQPAVSKGLASVAEPVVDKEPAADASHIEYEDLYTKEELARMDPASLRNQLITTIDIYFGLTDKLPGDYWDLVKLRDNLHAGEDTPSMAKIEQLAEEFKSKGFETLTNLLVDCAKAHHGVKADPAPDKLQYNKPKPLPLTPLQKEEKELKAKILKLTRQAKAFVKKEMIPVFEELQECQKKMHLESKNMELHRDYSSISRYRILQDDLMGLRWKYNKLEAQAKQRLDEIDKLKGVYKDKFEAQDTNKNTTTMRKS